MNYKDVDESARAWLAKHATSWGYKTFTLGAPMVKLPSASEKHLLDAAVNELTGFSFRTDDTVLVERRGLDMDVEEGFISTSERYHAKVTGISCNAMVYLTDELGKQRVVHTSEIYDYHHGNQ